MKCCFQALRLSRPLKSSLSSAWTDKAASHWPPGGLLRVSLCLHTLLSRVGTDEPFLHRWSFFRLPHQELRAAYSGPTGPTGGRNFAFSYKLLPGAAARFKNSFFFLHVITTSQQGATHQCTEEIHSLQHQFLVSDPSQAQLLQVLVGDLQQLFPADLFAFEVAHVRLEAVVQPWTTQNKEGKRGGLIRQTKRTDQFKTLPWLWANASQLQGLPP